MEPLSPPSVRVRRANPADAGAIARRLTEIFPVPRTEGWVRWRFFDRPDGVSRSWVAEAPGAGIVGHLAAEGRPAWIDGRPDVVFTGAYLFIAEEFRGGKVLSMLSRASAELADHRWQNFPFDRSVPAVHRFLHREDETGQRMDQWVRWHSGTAAAERAPRRLAPLVRPLAGVFVRADTAAARRRTASPVVRPGPADPEAHDDLARRSATFARAVRCRDWAWVAWRWLQRHEVVDVAHVPVSPGRISGYVAWRRHPLTGAGQIVDLLADDAASAGALLRHAADELRHREVDLVTFDVVDTRPGMAAAFRAAGFLPRGIGPPLVAHAPPGASALSRDDWVMTLADTDHV